MDKNYIESLKVYRKEQDFLYSENILGIEYYESLIKISRQRIALAKQQNKIIKKQSIEVNEIINNYEIQGN